MSLSGKRTPVKYKIESETKDEKEIAILAAAKKMMDSECKTKFMVSDAKSSQAQTIGDMLNNDLVDVMIFTPGPFEDLKKELGEDVAGEWLKCDDACGCGATVTAFSNLNHISLLGENVRVLAFNTKESKYQQEFIAKRNLNLQMVHLTQQMLTDLSLPTVEVNKQKYAGRFAIVSRKVDGVREWAVFVIPNRINNAQEQDLFADMAAWVKSKPVPTSKPAHSHSVSA